MDGEPLGEGDVAGGSINDVFKQRGPRFREKQIVRPSQRRGTSQRAVKARDTASYPDQRGTDPRVGNSFLGKKERGGIPNTI